MDDSSYLVDLEVKAVGGEGMKIGMVSGIELMAGRANITGTAGRRILAQQVLAKETGQGRLPNPGRAGKQVCMAEMAVRDGLSKVLHDPSVSCIVLKSHARSCASSLALSISTTRL